MCDTESQCENDPEAGQQVELEFDVEPKVGYDLVGPLAGQEFETGQLEPGV